MESEEYKSDRLDISSDDPSFSSLKSVRRKNLRRIIFAYLNINSLRNKVDALLDRMKGNVDILVISETKLDDLLRKANLKLLISHHLFEGIEMNSGVESWFL